LKKPTKGNKFSITLKAVDITTTVNARSDGGAQRSTSSRKLYEFELPLDGENEYIKGEYPFEIAIPHDVIPPAASADGVVGAVATIAGALSRQPTHQIKWQLRAQLDIPGALDMRKKLDINVV